jgi:LuxR family maltose regulon positive regulatory protein
MSTSMPDEIRNWVDLHYALSLAEAKSLSKDRTGLLDSCAATEQATELARRLNRGAELMQARLLRTRILASLGEPAEEREQEEILDQCRVVGMIRLLRHAGLSVREDVALLREPEVGKRPDAAEDIVGDRSFLTTREQEILHQLATRMSNKEIAISMGLGEETVKWHLKNLFRKLEAGDRRGVVSRARSLGLL